MTPKLDPTLVATESILIKASAASIWRTITTPACIKQFLFGTDACTDWKEGSSIEFRGEYGPNKQTYCDKGLVVENREPSLLVYRYWSGFSGLEEKLENFSKVSYRIEETQGLLRLTWLMEGFVDTTRRDHTQMALPSILAQIKSIAEA